MGEQSETRAHVRTRRDHSTETAEDYVEAVDDITREQGKCRVIDLARRFGVSHVTVSKTVARLVASGYLATEPYGPVELTRKGKRLAIESRERHDIVLRFLLAIGVSENVASIDAEGIEHHVSPETLQKLRQIADSAGRSAS